MGDLVESTTRVDLPIMCYEVSGSSTLFEVEANTHMTVSLTKTPGSRCDYVIQVIERPHNRSLVKIENNTKPKSRVEHVILPKIITGDFTKFWLSWYNGKIQLGKDGVKVPLLVHKCPNAYTIKYITFKVLGNGHNVEGKCRLYRPPSIEMPTKPKCVEGGKPEWVKAENQIPDDAIIGGFENESLYIIRAQHRGSLTPGKFVPSEGVGYIPWGGQDNEKQDFDVLVGFNYMWVPTSSNKIPVEAVPGGYSEDRHETLYIGRACHEGFIIPGKVQPSHKVCYIPFEGREIAKTDYEILIDPSLNSACSNSFFNVDNSRHPEIEQADDITDDSSDNDYYYDV